MKTVSLLLGLSLFSFGCNLGGGIRPASSEVLDYRVDDNQLQSVEDDADAQGGAGNADQSAWNELRSRARELFQSELDGDFGLPLAILEQVNEIDLEVQADQTVTANFEVNTPFLAQGVDVAATLRINQQTQKIDDEFVVEGVKRLTVSHDLFSTTADAVIFNADEEPIFTAAFDRTDDALNLLIANANNENSFLLNVDRDELFLGREKDHDGQISENFEFQARVNTDQLAGRFDAKIIFIGNISVCFGESPEGQLDRLGCDEIDPKVNEIGQDIGAF